jgi:hypothetical protein
VKNCASYTRNTPSGIDSLSCGAVQASAQLASERKESRDDRSREVIALQESWYPDKRKSGIVNT